MRTPIIAGNWKMYKTVKEATDLAVALGKATEDISGVEIVVCPTYTSLWMVGSLQKQRKNVKVGAQGMFWKEQGAWTSQISPAMLKDAGCEYVIIGHSETRGRFGTVDAELEKVLPYFGETDETINMKAKFAFEHGLIPIVCCGEMLAERKAGQTDQVVAAQIRKDIAGFTDEQVKSTVIAYEPVWAIGTGEVCDSAEANRVCGVIRQVVATMYGQVAGDAVRIQYGGSVKPDNAAELLHKPHIDGALVGGASLKCEDFVAIIKGAL
jgi:triosephosphate isomerase (TIM)